MVVLYQADGGPQPNVTLTVTAPFGAVVSPVNALTDANGDVTLSLRLGRSTQPQTFTVAGPGVTPLSITPTVTPLPTGTILTLANVSHTQLDKGVPGPATVAQIGSVYGMTLDSAGNLYFVDSSDCRVRMLDPNGVLTNIAGSGTCTSAGNGGPALSAGFQYPEGLALDEADQLLYVSDTRANVIRVVDLANGTISAFAGGGTNSTSPAFGDGSAASNCTFLYPTHLAFRSEANGPALYVTDAQHQRIRKITIKDGLINAWVSPGAQNVGPFFKAPYGADYLSACDGSQGCNVVWDAAGNAYFSAYVQTASGPETSIVERFPDGSMTLVGGGQSPSSGVTTDGVPATAAYLSNASPPGIAIDPGGDIYYADNNANRIRRIEASTGRVYTVAGTGTQGLSGDYGPATSANVAGLFELAIDANLNLYFGDFDYFAVREVSGVAFATEPTAALAAVGATTTAGTIDQNALATFKVKLTDENNSPLGGYTVNWASVTPGGYLSAASSQTSGLGVATMLAQAGLAPGNYVFQASFTDLGGNNISGSPVQFTLTANVPDAGLTFTVINEAHTGTESTGYGISGVDTHPGSLRGSAVASDGTVYVADYGTNRVLRLDPSGVVDSIAGTGTAGFLGDGQIASAAELNGPSGVALDEADGLLYVADSNNNRVRIIDLTAVPPLIDTFAGAGGTNPRNDGQQATSANLSQPTHLYLHTDNGTPYLYISDISHSAIRRVNLNTTVINTWVDQTVPVTNGVFMQDCGGTDGCAIAFRPDGSAYISMHYSTGVCYAPTGVVLYQPNLDPDGGYPNGIMVGVVGSPNCSFGNVQNGASAFNFSMNGGPDLVLDPTGRMIMTESSTNVVYYMDYTTGIDGGFLETLAGTGTAGYSGDMVPASQIELNNPWGVIFTPDGHMLISDSNNDALREIY